MMRRKLLHRMKEVCGATSRIMKDELIALQRILWETYPLGKESNVSGGIIDRRERSAIYIGYIHSVSSRLESKQGGRL